MEIIDLQINDWVYDKSFTPSNFPCRIYSIEGRYPRRDKDFNDKPLIDVWVGDGFLTSHIENIEPIPITIEILTKNGFTKVNSQRYDYGCPDTDCYVKVNPKKNMIHVNGRNANCNLYYHSFIHELQHALRLCGLNEFADNFKI